MKASAVVVAAGQSHRMGNAVHKPYLILNGRPVLAHVLSVLEKSRLIGEIILVIASEDRLKGHALMKKFGFKKIKRIVDGGKKRQDSVMKGIAALNPDCEYVVIQDACRPFLSEKMISGTLSLARKFGAAITVVPVTDTIKRVKSKMIEATLDRSRIWGAQTPQTFRVELIRKACEKAFKDGFYGTDDSMLVERTGGRVGIVIPDRVNMKISQPDDLVIAEAIMRKNR